MKETPGFPGLAEEILAKGWLTFAVERIIIYAEFRKVDAL